MNNYIDLLETLGSAVVIHSNQNPAYHCGIAYDAGTYKTIGTSFQFGGLDNLSASEFTRADLMAAYLDFFEEAEPLGILGDVNHDDRVNSTDALIILSCDVGMDVSSFCPMTCGDVNEDGEVNSTDALIITSYDVGIDADFPLGSSGCPSNEATCSGCMP